MTTAPVRLSFSRPLITVLPALAAIGGYLGELPLGFAHLSIYRLLMIALLPLSIVALRWPRSSVSVSYLVLSGVWLSYGGISLLWSPDFGAGVVELLAIGFGISVGFVLVGFRVFDEYRLDWLRQGWVLAFLSTAAVAGWEYATGSHLESSFSLSRPAYLLDVPYMQSTLGQPNNYGAFVAICVPFLLWSMSAARWRAARLLYGLLTAAAVVIVFQTGSRLALVATAVELLVFAGMAARQIRRALMLLIIGAAVSLALVTTGLVWVDWSTGGLPNEWAQNPTIAKFAAIVETSGGDESASVRWNLLLDGVWMIGATLGRGVGAGGFQPTMAAGRVPYSTWTTSGGEAVQAIDPHNLVIEVAAQYGVAVFAVFALWLGLCAVFFWRRWRQNSRPAGVPSRRWLSMCFFTSLIGFVFVSPASSAMLRQSWTWFYIASLLVAALYLRRPPSVVRHDPAAPTLADSSP